MTVHQIIGGRLRGILKQFIPGALVLLSCLVFGVGFRFTARDVIGLVAFGIASYVSVSMVGLYFSICRLHFLLAWVLTIAVGMVLPPLLASTAEFHSRPGDLFPGIFGFVHLIIVTLAWFLLYKRLQKREFALAAA